MSSITPRQIQQIINEQAQGLKPSTIRSYYGTVRSLFGDAVGIDVIGRSPCRGIKLPSSETNEKQIVNPEELHTLAEAIGGRWRCIVYLGGVMGLRFGEAIAIRGIDMDLVSNRLRVTRTVSEVNGRIEIGRPKTGSSVRTLILPKPLSKELGKHIDEHLSAPEDLLFADAFGGPVRRANFRCRVWLPAVAKTGLDGLTFHGLRHSAATQWMADGVDARTVQQLLGHADPRLVLRLYAHSTDRALAAAAEEVTDSYWPR